jgi:hypothetical protein
MEEDGRGGSTAGDVEQVKRLRPRCEGDESPLCLGVNRNGERCSRTRREPFCDRHLYQWEALPDETRAAVNALAELPENAFNHALWDNEHLKLRTFLRDVYTRLQAEAVGDSARAWDAAHEQAQEEAKGALLAVQDTLRGECAPALIPCQALTLTASCAEVQDKSSKREEEMAGLRSVLTGTASLQLTPSASLSGARTRSRSTSRENRWLTRAASSAEDVESLRAEVAALRKAVKSIAALVETSSEENKATVLTLCAALDE